MSKRPAMLTITKPELTGGLKSPGLKSPIAKSPGLKSPGLGPKNPRSALKKQSIFLSSMEANANKRGQSLDLSTTKQQLVGLNLGNQNKQRTSILSSKAQDEHFSNMVEEDDLDRFFKEVKYIKRRSRFKKAFMLLDEFNEKRVRFEIGEESYYQKLMITIISKIAHNYAQRILKRKQLRLYYNLLVKSQRAFCIWFKCICTYINVILPRDKTVKVVPYLKDNVKEKLESDDERDQEELEFQNLYPEYDRKNEKSRKTVATIKIDVTSPEKKTFDMNADFKEELNNDMGFFKKKIKRFDHWVPEDFVEFVSNMDFKQVRKLKVKSDADELVLSFLNILMLWGLYYKRLKDYKLSFLYFFKAYELTSKFEMSINAEILYVISKIKTHFGIFHLEFSKLDEAIVILEESLVILNKILSIKMNGRVFSNNKNKEKHKIRKIIKHISMVLWNLAHCYEKKKFAGEIIETLRLANWFSTCFMHPHDEIRKIVNKAFSDISKHLEKNISISEELDVHTKEFLKHDQGFWTKFEEKYNEGQIENAYFHNKLYEKYGVDQLNQARFFVKIKKRGIRSGQSTSRKEEPKGQPALVKPHHVKTQSLSSNKNESTTVHDLSEHPTPLFEPTFQGLIIGKQQSWAELEREYERKNSDGDIFLGKELKEDKGLIEIGWNVLDSDEKQSSHSSLEEISFVSVKEPETELKNDKRLTLRNLEELVLRHGTEESLKEPLHTSQSQSQAGENESVQDESNQNSTAGEHELSQEEKNEKNIDKILEQKIEDNLKKSKIKCKSTKRIKHDFENFLKNDYMERQGLRFLKNVLELKKYETLETLNHSKKERLLLPGKIRGRGMLAILNREVKTDAEVFQAKSNLQEHIKRLEEKRREERAKKYEIESKTNSSRSNGIKNTILDIIIKRKAELGLEKTAAGLILKKKEEVANKEKEQMQMEKLHNREERDKLRDLFKKNSQHLEEIKGHSGLRIKRKHSRSHTDFASIGLHENHSKQAFRKEDSVKFTNENQPSPIERPYRSQIEEERILNKERIKTRDIGLMVADNLRRDIEDARRKISGIKSVGRSHEKSNGLTSLSYSSFRDHAKNSSRNKSEPQKN